MPYYVPNRPKPRSLEDLQLLQVMEDKLDNEAADAALMEPGESIPWDQVKTELGIK